MKFRYSLFIVLIICLAAHAEQKISKKTGPIPIDVLFKDTHKIISPLLSPDGTNVAYLAQHNDSINIWVKSLATNECKPLTHNTNQNIPKFMWSFDSNHILYIQDNHGDENWKLYGITLNTQQIDCYTPFDGTTIKELFYTYNPDKIVISLNNRDIRSHDLYLLDITTKELTLLEENPGDVSQWATNITGQCIARKRVTDENIILETKNESNAWSVLETWQYEQNTPSLQDSMPILLHSTVDGNHLFMLDSKNGPTAALVKLNVKTGTKEIIAQDMQYDIAPFYFHPDSYEIIAPTYLIDFATLEIQAAQCYKDRLEWHCFDDTIKNDFAYLKTVDNGDIYITSQDATNQQWLVRFMKDDQPDSYWLYNRTTKTSQLLFYSNSALLPYTCAKTEPISYPTRDGLTVHGYLTKGLNQGSKKPLIVYVHGGPCIRDIWCFNSITQFFATRGYSVLQPNYRGSAGYGNAFITAGDKQWGGTMHDDLIDGVQWAIDNGYADADKVVIFGVSFGGYAALLGATKNPETFCCAIDIAGISDLVHLAKTFCPYYKGALQEMYHRVGHPDHDKEFLQSRSPLFHLDNVSMPLLIAQGANDARVVRYHSDAVVEALQKRGNNPTYLLFEDEGHGLTKETSKLTFFNAVESFLSEHC